MKQSVLYKTIGTLSFLSSGLMAYAQGSTIEIDTLSKVIGFIGIVIGGLVGYISLQNAKKLADLELKFMTTIAQIEEKIELKFDSRIKDVENKMVTKHDLNSLTTIIKLQHENLKQSQTHLDEKINTLQRHDSSRQ